MQHKLGLLGNHVQDVAEALGAALAPGLDRLVLHARAQESPQRARRQAKTKRGMPEALSTRKDRVSALSWKQKN